MGVPTRVLLVDGDSQGRDLIYDCLQREYANIEIVQADTQEAFNKAVAMSTIDLVILEYRLPWGDGNQVLTTLRDHLPSCPVIMCTAYGDETTAVCMMKAGLDDYVVKLPENMPRLITAVRRALKRTQQAGTLHEVGQRYRDVFGGVPIGLYRTTPDGHFLDANSALVDMLGFSSREDLLMTPANDLYADPVQRRHWKARMQNEGVIRQFELQVRRRDGRVIWVEDNARLVCDTAGVPHYYEGSLQDISRRKQAEAALQQRAARLASLHEAAVAISKPNDLQELYQVIVEQATQLVDATGAELYLANEERAECHCVAAYNSPHQGIGHVIAYGDDTVGAVAETVQPLRNTSYGVWAGHTEEGAAAAVLAAPLVYKDRLTAVLQVIQMKEVERFSQEDMELLLLLADQAAIAIENDRLYDEVQRLASTDELTGLHNRRYFFELGEREIKRARRLERPLSAIMLDIDRFKEINDTYGHFSGDRVLQVVADRVRRNVREIDILARLGGEEFAVLLGDTRVEKACAIAERLRRNVSTVPVSTRGGEVAATISLGVAGLSATIHDLSGLLNCADQALYDAKTSGRDRVAAYT